MILLKLKFTISVATQDIRAKPKFLSLVAKPCLTWPLISHHVQPWALGFIYREMHRASHTCDWFLICAFSSCCPLCLKKNHWTTSLISSGDILQDNSSSNFSRKLSWPSKPPTIPRILPNHSCLCLPRTPPQQHGEFLKDRYYVWFTFVSSVPRAWHAMERYLLNATWTFFCLHFKLSSNLLSHCLKCLTSWLSLLNLTSPASPSTGPEGPKDGGKMEETRFGAQGRMTGHTWAC